MAARISKELTDEWRMKIQTSMLINRLMENAFGSLETEMTSGQIKSAEILLKKTFPDLPTTINLGNEDDKPFAVAHSGSLDVVTRLQELMNA